jgi:hypothetical protein
MSKPEHWTNYIPVHMHGGLSGASMVEAGKIRTGGMLVFSGLVVPREQARFIA